MAHERICVVCGKHYEYCKNCSQYAHLPTWMYAYCSEPCKETYLIINKYDYKHISATDALDALEEYNVNIKEPGMVKSMEEIKKEAKSERKKRKKENKYKEWLPIGKKDEETDNTVVEEKENVTDVDNATYINNATDIVDLIND